MSKKKPLNWTQNIEYIFTKEKLDEFVKEGLLEKVWRTDRYYYIKRGCKRWFQSAYNRINTTTINAKPDM